jgi:hypothetical protein
MPLYPRSATSQGMDANSSLFCCVQLWLTFESIKELACWLSTIQCSSILMWMSPRPFHSGRPSTWNLSSNESSWWTWDDRIILSLISYSTIAMGWNKLVSGALSMWSSWLFGWRTSCYSGGSNFNRLLI